MVNKLMDNAKDYHGNFVTEKGEIYNALGKPLKVRNGAVKVVVDGKKRTLMVARIVYEVFSGNKITSTKVILFKDGNPENVAYENIEAVSRKTYFKKIKSENQRKRLFSKEEQEQIIKEYDRENRRAHGFKGAYSKPTFREMAIKYECSKSTIQKILDGVY